jgi:hypothetical protein
VSGLKRSARVPSGRRAGTSPGTSSLSYPTTSGTYTDPTSPDSNDFHVNKADYYPKSATIPDYDSNPNAQATSSIVDVVAPGRDAFEQEVPPAPKSEGYIPADAEQSIVTTAVGPVPEAAETPAVIVDAEGEAQPLAAGATPTGEANVEEDEPRNQEEKVQEEKVHEKQAKPIVVYE